MKKPAQTQQILQLLKTGNTITSIEALRHFGCLRLGARIYDIRNMGYLVNTRMKTVSGGKRVAEYYL